MIPAEASQQGICEQIHKFRWIYGFPMTQQYSAAPLFLSLQKVMSSGRTGWCWQPCSMGVLCPAGGILDGWWE